ncbi:hypothetical protein Tsubulata_001874 [Turnera subulata]|uniref:Uncharacterized protein n=1 Tax=Turnera subulata TaxID=218843 RepID=A0A9Q0F140_9ROSI|nr:hypothetical protein Tsubulata_001874 [Turnera subulata]
MEFVLEVALYVVLGLALFRSLHLLRASKAKLPPGPPRLPIIGNLLELGDKPHRSMARLAKVLGPLMTLKLGQVTTIAVSSPSLAREIVQKHDSLFSNKYLHDAARVLDHHEFGITWLPFGPLWRNL